MKKLISIVTICILLFTSACGGTSTASTSSTKDNSVTETSSQDTSEPEKRTTVTIVMKDFLPGQSFDNMMTHYIEDKLNLTLDVTVVPQNEIDKQVNLKLASGDRPDIIQFGSDDVEVKYAQAGILVSIDDYMDKYTNIKSLGDDEYWNKLRHEDGKIYIVPSIDERLNSMPLYRKDWLDKLGLPIPTNLDEYYTVATAFTKDDPDGNGVNDTFAICGRGDNLRFFNNVFSAFGSYPKNFVLYEGKLIHGALVPSMKDALVYLNKMYKDGLIDPEFVTDNGTRYNDKTFKGVYGAGVSNTSLTDPFSNDYKKFKANIPDGEWVLAPTLEGPNGVGIGPFLGGNIRGSSRNAVLKEGKNIEGAFKLLDYLSSEEGAITSRYGIEGEQYEINSDGRLSKTITDEESKALGLGQIRLATPELIKIPVLKPGEPKATDLEQLEKDVFFKPTDGMLLPQYSSSLKELEEFINVSYFKMITGDVEIDGGFEKMTEEFYKRGGDKLTQGYNEAYEARKK